VNSRPPFDWSDVRYFLAVAREGSTIAAAKALGVSQPTVQRRIAALEEALRRSLFEPHPTGTRLTDLGREMLPYAEAIERAAVDFERNLAASDKGLAGTIRVTCAEGMAAHYVAPIIEAFRARHPDVRIDLLMTDRYVDLLKGEADIAVRANRPGDSSLVARRIADVPWAVYASRAYVERRGRPAGTAEIGAHAIVVFAGEMAGNFAGRWLREIAPQAAVGASGNTMLGVVAAVRSGAGLAPLPMMIAERENDLVRVLETCTELASGFYLVMHPDARRIARMRAFCDFFVAETDAYRPLLSGRAPKTPSAA